MCVYDGPMKECANKIYLVFIDMNYFPGVGCVVDVDPKTAESPSNAVSCFLTS